MINTEERGRLRPLPHPRGPRGHGPGDRPPGPGRPGHPHRGGRRRRPRRRPDQRRHRRRLTRRCPARPRRRRAPTAGAGDGRSSRPAGVGRIVKPHGLRGDVIVVADDQPRRAGGAGSVLHRRRPGVRGGAVVAPPGPLHRGLRRRGRHRGRRGAAGHRAVGRAPRGPRRPVGPRPDRLGGAWTPPAPSSGRVGGRGQSGQRPAGARRRRPDPAALRHRARARGSG